MLGVPAERFRARGVNRATRRAALRAAAVVDDPRPINWDAVNAHETALLAMAEPSCCPCCGFLWDVAALRGVVETNDHDAYVRWMRETLMLPANAVGDDLGQRARAMTKPVWVRGYSDELGVDVARIVGYRVEWEDGTHGPTRKTFSGARADLAQPVPK